MERLKIQPTKPVKPTYHQAIWPILEAEGCIKNEVLWLTVKQSMMECLHRWADGPTNKMKCTVLYWTSLK